MEVLNIYNNDQKHKLIIQNTNKSSNNTNSNNKYHSVNI